MSDGERLILLQTSALLKDFRNYQYGETANDRDRVGKLADPLVPIQPALGGQEWH
jgi:hypothetical protein